MTHNIFLVGLMGSGKTTVGRALAKRLGLEFIDADHEIERRTGVSIATIFEIEGESSFRQREADVIRDLTAREGIVLATGGGAILSAQSRMLLRERGTVIYLRAAIHNILQRTRHDKSRPLLRTEDPRRTLEALEAQRGPLYREVAHLTVETGRPNVHVLINTLLVQLDTLGVLHGTPASMISSPLPPSCRTVQVALDVRSYPIHIAAHLLEDERLLGEAITARQVLIVSNTTVAPLYLNGLKARLMHLGKCVMEVILPDGEAHKTWESVQQVFDRLLGEQCDRKTTLLALGGGVIGDMTGFAAACYMRGVPFVQIPTTLLAQVDSSVGGKTGINHPLGKNMIGAFYQPQAVLADLTTLNTLPDRELSAGLAEVIKHGAIIDPQLFDWLEQNMAALRARDPAALMHVVARSCEIKADIVRQDERESGLRAILNFGHTFAHAIEAGLGYGTWLHGEAVGCGMVMAADLSHRLGSLDYVSVIRIRSLVEAAGLPIVAPDLGETCWRDWMAVDKKNEGGAIRFVVLEGLGAARTRTVPDAVLSATLSACVHSSP